MAVNDIDPAWSVHAADRRLVGDLFAGRATAIGHVRGMPGFDRETLKATQDGAYFLPIVARTVEAFGGLVFAKTPARTAPSGLDAYLGDVTGSGQDIDRFAEQAFDGVLLTGAVCVVVDYPQAEAEMTKAQAEAEGVRPSLRLYAATSILGARFRKVGQARKLAQVRLLELVEEAGADEFAQVSVARVRVLDLDGSGLYRQRLFRSLDGRWRQFGEAIEPKRNGARIDSIPAFFSNTRDGEPSPAKPPMTDLAEVSVAHLTNSASMEWALYWLGNPMLFGKMLGLQPGETVKVGSSNMIHANDAAADMKIVQASADSIGALSAQMDNKRRDAALMGARMLLEDAKAAIAAETARIQRAGETSVVAAIANAVSDCLTKALAFMAEWAGVSGKVEYWLNADLNPAGLSAQDLTALLAAWQSGAISKRDLFAKLQQHEVVDPSKSFEAQEEEIAAEGEESEPDEEPEAEAA